MIALYIVLGILALLFLCLLLPVSLRVSYRGELWVRARILGVPVTLFPRREKPGKAGAKRAAKPPSKRRQKREKEREKLIDLSRMLKEDGVGGTLRFFGELAKLLWRAARRVLRAVTVRKLWLRMRIGGEDAADTALQYGRACAALFPGIEMIGTLVRVRRRDVKVTPLFPEGESSAQFEIRLWVTPLKVLWAGLCLVCGLTLRLSGQRAGPETGSDTNPHPEDADVYTKDTNSKTQEVTSHG